MTTYPRFDGTQSCVDAPTPAARAFVGAVGADPAPAQRICAGCSFLQGCREYALATDVYGVWGGTTEPDREQIRVQHEAPAPSSISGELDALVLSLRAVAGDREDTAVLPPQAAAS